MNFILKEEVLEVPIDAIVVNPFQPRRHFLSQDLEELANSIKAVGLLHPPLVRPIGDNIFELISGERRYRAMQLIGMKVISVLVKNSSAEVSAQAALIENIQRVDLNPIDTAKALKSLIEEFKLDQEALCIRIGKKKSVISHYLKLLSLPKNIQEAISKETILMGHAKALLSLEGFEKQILLFELIMRDDLSVKETEEAALRIGDKAKRKTLVYVNRDFYLEQIAERLRHALGTKVAIQGKGKKGRISIDYYTLSDLDRLMDIFESSSNKSC